jgi:quaternary ammonium compound-resistance protein SugE
MALSVLPEASETTIPLLPSSVHQPGRDARRTRQAKTTRSLFTTRPGGASLTWVVLIVAGLLEVVWALALKESDGFAKLGPTLLFVVAAVLSMGLLGVALRNLPVGTGYAVWTGTGAVGAAVAGMIIFGEAATLSRILPIALVAVGIVSLALSE